MADVPRAYIDNFTQGINSISASSQAALSQELLSIDYSNMTKAIDKAAIPMRHGRRIRVRHGGYLRRRGEEP